MLHTTKLEVRNGNKAYFLEKDSECPSSFQESEVHLHAAWKYRIYVAARIGFTVKEFRITAPRSALAHAYIFRQ